MGRLNFKRHRSFESAHGPFSILCDYIIVWLSIDWSVLELVSLKEVIVVDFFFFLLHE